MSEAEPGFYIGTGTYRRDSQAKERLQHTLQKEYPAPNMKLNRLIFY
jgi:hypothetical protein